MLMHRVIQAFIIAALCLSCNVILAQSPQAGEKQAATENAEDAKAIPIEKLKFDFNKIKNLEEMHFLYYRTNFGETVKQLRGTFSMRTTWKDNQLSLIDYSHFITNNSYSGTHNVLKVKLDHRLGLQSGELNHHQRMEINKRTIKIDGDVEARTFGIPTGMMTENIWEKDAIVDFALFRVATLFPKQKGLVIKLGKIARLGGDATEFVDDATATCLGEVQIKRFNETVTYTKYEIRGDAVTRNYGLDLYFDKKNRLMRIEVHHLDARFERMRQIDEAPSDT